MDQAVRIETAGTASARAAARVLVRSHAEYPAFRHLFPRPGQRRRVLRPFLETTVRDTARHGRLDVALIGDRVVGTALWMPPGAWPASAGRRARMTPALTVALLAAGGRARSWLRTGAALDADIPDGWYLIALGIEPSAQRRGVGRRLVEPALVRADAEGAAVGLHTSDPANVDFYTRFGFVVTRPFGELFPGGPAYLTMRRSPEK
ncbi:GNAT family N-acetyltransferase [Paractinoplanes lichenicola]|uniref:GNAT family N-acetyltransferase n=1 Tax=Paractinoplanes lichenicola TaxID=2802976 RepID=A0ABS1VT01_9ACTN|nr:GNAT family N-acetyltransferase [Actinoplanes lichenicola]MBL7257592.1 GNAT family N-acetyltransferase [Actinoplanes lichenicola]